MEGGSVPWGAARHLQPGSSTSSPLDYMKAGAAAADRALALGLTPTRLSDSFGGNQSFPRSSVTSQQLARKAESPLLAPSHLHPTHLNWSLVSAGGRGGSRLLHSPGKAWAILAADSGKVLVCNSVLSALLGHREEELRDTVLWDMVVRREASQAALDQLELDPETGETVGCSGRVVRLRHREGALVAASLTVRSLPDTARLMVLLEPVTRSVGHLAVCSGGSITSMDQGAEVLFQARASDCLGSPVLRLLQGLHLPGAEEGSRSRQSLVGQVVGQGEGFPVSCLATREGGGGCALTVWVYSSLSGLLLLDREGRIVEGDATFCSLVLGHPPGGLEGTRIEQVIPGFYEEFEVPSCDRTDESLGCDHLSPSPPCPDLPVQEERSEEERLSPLEEICLNSRAEGSSEPPSPSAQPPGEGGKENLQAGGSPVFRRPSTLCVRTPVRVPMEVLTSTPASKQASARKALRQPRGSESPMPSGCFYGLARHRGGQEVAVLYQVKRVVLKDGGVVHCVWVTRDSEEAGGRTTNLTNLTLGTTAEEVEATLPLVDNSLEALTAGPYSLKYGTLDQVGQGAFGSVRLSYHLEDRQLVVTKFITAAKVPVGSWVEGERGERLPMEASLLQGLNHPGIVKVLDVFQNPNYVQMVMEKHGDMDLFEFIDRNPVMDEPLACLIFRQVVSAIDYLHARSILHRDVKDENVIIDHRFSCKLIDFGSAVFFRPGERFHTFYGTVEYCSPEVLQGCSYEGPQLEMWSVGVLLYIIIFGENPFYDTQDTIRAELHPPHNDVSGPCWELLQALLDRDPEHRASLWHVKEHQWVTQQVDGGEYQLYDVIPCSEAELRPPTHYREGGGRQAARAGDHGRPFLSQCSGQQDSREASLELSSLDSAALSSCGEGGLGTSLEVED